MDTMTVHSSTNEIDFMTIAIEEGKKCKSKDSTDPKVGAVVAKDGKIINKAFRGEEKDGEHTHIFKVLF